MYLYEIQNAVRDALDAMVVDEETGEIVDAGALAAVECAAVDKMEGAGLYVRELNLEADTLKTEIDRLIARKKSLEKRSSYIKGLMLGGLDALGGKVKTPRLTISTITRKSVELDDNALDVLPDGFVRVKREADKTAIKAAIEGGFEIPGAHLVENRSITLR